MKTGPRIALSAAALAAALALGAWAGYRLAPPAPMAESGDRMSAGTAKPTRKPRYYRNPMGLPDTSPVPKKDPMGMDYLPVFDDEEAGSSKDGADMPAHTLGIAPEKVQKLGVKVETAERRVLDRTVHASGRVDIDETRLHSVTAKFEGYIERLHVAATGQPVARGQTLFETYSPELVSAQREYAVAAQGVERLAGAGGEAQDAMRRLAESSLRRLKNWDISDEQIKALARDGATRRTLSFRAPAGGVVTEKKAVQGMRFMPGEVLYQIADLSSVWVQADVFEQDIGAVAVGQKALVRINAYPGESFAGRVAYVYPTLTAATRTAQVRIELPNPKGRLKPAMFAEVDIATGGGAAVTVPASALIDGGARQVVIVRRDEGRFEPRPVKVGQRGRDFVEILDGVQAGEPVVVSANFLIDAESKLKAALSGMQKPAEAPAASVGHRATGILRGIEGTTASIAHDPVASLDWPAMRMDFTLANPALGAGLKPGAAVAFEFVERQPGEWVVTALQAR